MKKALFVLIILLLLFTGCNANIKSTNVHQDNPTKTPEISENIYKTSEPTQNSTPEPSKKLEYGDNIDIDTFITRFNHMREVEKNAFVNDETAKTIYEFLNNMPDMSKDTMILSDSSDGLKGYAYVHDFIEIYIIVDNNDIIQKISAEDNLSYGSLDLDEASTVFIIHDITEILLFTGVFDVMWNDDVDERLNDGETVTIGNYFVSRPVDVIIDIWHTIDVSLIPTTSPIIEPIPSSTSAMSSNSDYDLIKEYAKDKWGSDTDMIEWEYEQQVSAYETINNLPDSDIKSYALSKWKDGNYTDWTMVEWEYEQQTAAYNEMQKTDWVGKQDAIDKWTENGFTDWTMVEWEYENQ